MTSKSSRSVLSMEENKAVLADAFENLSSEGESDCECR